MDNPKDGSGSGFIASRRSFLAGSNAGGYPEQFGLHPSPFTFKGAETKFSVNDKLSIGGVLAGTYRGLSCVIC
jgi:hypothetical protein